MLKILIPLLFLVFLLFIVDRMLFGPTGASKETDIFVVPQEKEDFNVAQALKEENFIKSEGAFQFLLNFFAEEEEIKPGGYRLYTRMNARQVLTKITGKQDLFWVTVSSCPRKEQVGEKLAEALGWDKKKLEKWNALYKDTKPEYFEGVYYPDTYLIPADESETQIAERFINRFNEKFASLADKFTEKNIKWTTGLKIASLIAREAAGTEDMGLISGIIWNRLLKNMPLQITRQCNTLLVRILTEVGGGELILPKSKTTRRITVICIKGFRQRLFAVRISKLSKQLLIRKRQTVFIICTTSIKKSIAQKPTTTIKPISKNICVCRKKISFVKKL